MVSPVVVICLNSVVMGFSSWASKDEVVTAEVVVEVPVVEAVLPLSNCFNKAFSCCLLLAWPPASIGGGGCVV